MPNLCKKCYGKNQFSTISNVAVLLVYIKACPVLLLFGSYFPLFSQSCFVEECKPEPAVCPIPAQLCWSNAPVPDMLAPASRRHPFTPTRTPLLGRRPALPRPPPEGREAEALRHPIGWTSLSLTLVRGCTKKINKTTTGKSFQKVLNVSKPESDRTGRERRSVCATIFSVQTFARRCSTARGSGSLSVFHF